MNFHCRVFFYCIFILYNVFCHFGISDAQTATPSSSTNTPGRTVECKCVEAGLCNRTLDNQFIGGGQDLMRDLDCQASEVCCLPDLIIITGTDEYSTTGPTDYDPSISVSSTESTNYDCQCVSTYKCRSNLEENVDIIRNSKCSTSEICCSPDLIITNSIDDITTELTAYSPSTSEVSMMESTADNCQCISPQKCRTNPEDSIDVRTNIRCSISEICCTPENIISDSECGVRNVVGQNFSNNSNDTSFGEFPWMALLILTQIDPTCGKSSEYIIGGASLVSPKIVLTGVAVLRAVRNVTLLKVRAGEYDTTQGSDKEHKPHQERQVSKIIKHPKFLTRGQYINLALLEVAEPFTFDYHIKPICIPSISKTYDYDPSKCVTAGWGKIIYGPVPPHFTTPKKVDLTIVPNDQCQEELRKTHLGQRFHLLPSYICAKSQVGMDACQTDIGGSLVCPLRNDPNRYVQVGIVSWGVGCTNGLPGVYASLEKNSDWLTQEIQLR